jgi:transcriptional accessory protein Tex/SPT6
VKDAGDVLKVRQVIEVTVLAVDRERKRISLTLKKNPEGDSTSGHAEGKSAPGNRRGGREGMKPAGGSSRKPGDGKSQPEHAAPEKSPEERPADEWKRVKQGSGKPDHGRPQRGKPREEKVPFNNPFAAVFGKK